MTASASFADGSYDGETVRRIVLTISSGPRRSEFPCDENQIELIN